LRLSGLPFDTIEKRITDSLQELVDGLNAAPVTGGERFDALVIDIIGSSGILVAEEGK